MWSIIVSGRTWISSRRALSHCGRCFASTSTSTRPSQQPRSVARTEEEEHERRKDILIAQSENFKPPLFPKTRMPYNVCLPNERGIPDYDPEMPLVDTFKAMPRVMKTHFKQLKKELDEHSAAMGTGLYSPEFDESLGILRHDEAHPDMFFDTDEARKLWKTGCDSDWNQGFSTCELVGTDLGTALFRGNLSMDVVKDGKTDRAGWAAIRYWEKRSFLRKKYWPRWNSFSHLLVKCRGDGRSYKILLHCPGKTDVTWGNAWSYPLHTHGGPYWQFEKIPFSRFFHTVGGRIQDKQYKFPGGIDMSSIGITLMDRIEGPFQLELAYIGVCHDKAHMEKFAYERYSLPIWCGEGI